MVVNFSKLFCDINYFGCCCFNLLYNFKTYFMHLAMNELTYVNDLLLCYFLLHGDDLMWQLIW